jgi:hypothetical protein
MLISITVVQRQIQEGSRFFSKKTWVVIAGYASEEDKQDTVDDYIEVELIEKSRVPAFQGPSLFLLSFQF